MISAQKYGAMRTCMMMWWPYGSRWMAPGCGCMMKSLMDRPLNRAGVRPPAVSWRNYSASINLKTGDKQVENPRSGAVSDKL